MSKENPNIQDANIVSEEENKKEEKQSPKKESKLTKGIDKIKGVFSNKSEKEIKEERKEKEYKKEKYGEVNVSRAKIRRERLKEWEEMTEEERKEKYGMRVKETEGDKPNEQVFDKESYERAKELYELEKSRIETVKVESKLLKRSKITSKIWDKMPFTDRESLDEIKKEYQEKLEEYQEKRAERVSENVLATLNQNIKMAEQRALEGMESSKFEIIKKKYKWLGEQNVEKLLKKFDKEPKSKLGKFAARFMSLRTLTTGGLMSVGLLGGATMSAVGITAFAGRRFMGGTATSFMLYDMMKLGKEAKDLSFSKDQIEEMEVSELEEKMAQFEARAITNGENFQYDKNYKMLREAYAKKVKDKKKLSKALHDLDNTLDSTKESVRKEARNRKITAGTIGYIIAGALSVDQFQEYFGNNPEAVQQAKELGINTEANNSAEFADSAKKTLEKIPITQEDMLYEAEADATRVEQATVILTEQGVIPKNESVTVSIEDSAETEADTTQSTSAEDTKQAEKEVDTTQSTSEEDTKQAEKENIKDLEEKVIESTQENENLIAGCEMETIKESGNVWEAAQRMVKNGNITKEEFWEAWGNENSTVELPSGEEVHISELGLSHADDQVVFIPGDGDTPAKFDVVDYECDVFGMGSNEDLYNAFKSAGKEVPDWLNDAMGVETATETKQEIETFFVSDYNIDEHRIDESLLVDVDDSPARTGMGFIEDLGKDKYLIKEGDGFEKIKVEFDYNDDGTIKDMKYKEGSFFQRIFINFDTNPSEAKEALFEIGKKTPEEIKNEAEKTIKALRRIYYGFDQDSPEREFIWQKIRQVTSEHFPIQQGTVDAFNITLGDIDEASEMLDKENLKVSGFDGVDSVERMSAEELVEKAKSWTEAQEAIDESFDLYQDSIVENYGNGIFEIPNNDQFGRITMMFDYNDDGTVKNMMFKEYLADGQYPAFREIDEGVKIGEKFLKDDGLEKFQNYQLVKESLEVYPRMLSTLPEGSAEYEFIKESLGKKARQWLTMEGVNEFLKRALDLPKNIEINK